MALGRRRKSTRDHLACVTVGLETVPGVTDLRERAQNLRGNTKTKTKQNKTGGRLELAPVFRVFLLIFPSYD